MNDREPAPFLAPAPSEALMESDPPGLAAGAVVSGTLTVNAKSCFEVDGFLLLAPTGTRVVQDPIGVEIPQAGRFPVGATINSSGSYLGSADHDDELVAAMRRYFTASTQGVVILDPGMTEKP